MPAPKLQIFASEPSDKFGIKYLKMAPIAPGEPESGNLNLWLRIHNDEPKAVTISSITVSVAGSKPASKPFAGLKLTVAADGTADWQQKDDLIFDLPTSSSLFISVTCEGFSDPALIVSNLVAHASPNSQGSYRFWGAVGDLRPGEFWQTDGTAHANSFQQSYAYDVGVAVDASDAGARLPGTDGSQNSHYRIWGKPIYAIGSGVVTDFRNDFPTNQTPGEIDLGASQYDWKGTSPDGNGNFFTITTGTGALAETVLYAHMQPASLNPALQAKGATVKEGDFLGLVGNAGSSSGPHLHIHSNQAPTSQQGSSWTGPARPMPLRGTRTITWAGVSAANVLQNPTLQAGTSLNGRGIPAGRSAFWPADSAPVFLTDALVKHVAIADDGQLWVITTANRILTTSDLLPRRGIFLGVNPGGAAKALAISKQQPFIIDVNDKVRQGLPNGWIVLPGSPPCLRLSIDAATGVVWVVHLDGRILSFNPASKTWTEHPGTGRAKDICVVDGAVHVVGLDDRVYKETAGGKAWQALPGTQKVSRIAYAAASKRIWALSTDGSKVLSSVGDGNWGATGGLSGTGMGLAVHAQTPYVVTSDARVSVGELGWGWSRLRLVAPSG